MSNVIHIRDSRVTAVDESKIHGIKKINISIMNDLVLAKVELAFDVEAHAEYFMRHPASGQIKKISQIEFADGEVVKF